MIDANIRATVKVAPTNVGVTSIFVGATFTVALMSVWLIFSIKN
jgi:hypothetical protein